LDSWQHCLQCWIRAAVLRTAARMNVKKKAGYEYDKFEYK
jgi:ribosomal protein S26